MLSLTLESLNKFNSKFISGFLEKSYLLLKIKQYEPNVYFRIEFLNYIVKTAESGKELKKALKLRKKVFFEEKNIDSSNENPYEYDEFDFNYDHVLIYTKDTKELIGTYRVGCSKFTDKFYTQGEFNVEKFLRLDGVKMELGRACIESHHRSGAAITLIWKGLAQYAKQVGARYFFGCSSISKDNEQMLPLFISYLQENNQIDHNYNIETKQGYTYQLREGNPLELNSDHVTSYFPPLLKSYLRAGALISDSIAYDREFACFDMFTFLDIQKMNKKVYNKFFIKG